MQEEKIIDQKSIVKEKGSAFRKYQNRIIGTRSIFYFLKFEIINTLFSVCPGSIGLFIRHFLFRGLFRECGKGVQFGNGLILRGAVKMVLGQGVILDDYVVLDSKSEYNPGITVGDRCLVSRNTKLSTGYTGYVKISDDTIIGENCVVHGPGGIEIGSNVLISDGVFLNAGLHVFSDPGRNILSQGITAKGIKIGNDVWLGTGVIVKDNVKIGEGCVIEAGSLVGDSVPPYSIVLGNPAKVIGSRRK